MWLLCDWPVSVSLSLMCKTVQKSSPVYLKQRALSRAAESASQWLFYSFVLIFSSNSAAWLKFVTSSSGLQIVRAWRHHMTQGLMSW